MPILRQLVMYALRRVAADPRVRAKAAEVVRKDVAPGAKAVVGKVRTTLENAGDELEDLAREVDPFEHPGRFAKEFKKRYLDPEK